MSKKITKLSLLSLLVGGLFFTSCAPKYTASFNKSRTFYDDNTPRLVESEDKQEVDEPVTPAPEKVSDETLVASTDKNMIKRLAEIPSIKAIVEEHKSNVEEIRNSEADQKEISKQIRKEEKRAHKEVKKQLVRELKDIKKVNDHDASKAMNQKIFIGIVVAAAGIIVAILASGSLGAIAIIIGVGLIAWGIIEQGGI
ncbi:MAG: hypothetical protein P8X57_10625 [Cyclobacteriaceae bacterium]